MRAGILKQKGNLWAARILSRCGVFSAAELQAAAALAQQFGRGSLTATSRGTIEIDGIAEEQLDGLLTAIGESGLRLGGTGTTVRAVTACKGTDCVHGAFDVHALASRLEEAFLGQPVPKKFKIGVFGCWNSQGKARSQDLGILPAGPGTFTLFIGGMMGKTPQLGQKLAAAVPEAKLPEAVGMLLAVYRREGEAGERFGHLLLRQPVLLGEIDARVTALAN